MLAVDISMIGRLPDWDVGADANISGPPQQASAPATTVIC
jgi:hypothetical protein